MAYDSEITYPFKRGGVMVIQIVETDAATASESDEFEVFERGRIVSFSQDFISGAGATTDPALGREAGWTSNTRDEVMADLPTAPGAHHHHVASIPYYSPKEKMTLKSGVDTGTNNKIITEMVIVEEVTQ